MSNYYILKDGTSFQARDAADFVTVLRSTSSQPERSERAFMQAVARRCMVQTRATIRTYDADAFLADLQANNYVRAIPIN